MLRRLAKSLAYSPRTWRLMDRVEALLPPLRVWHRVQYQRHFQKRYAWERLFSGVYPTLAAATAAIPNGRLVGYDNAETAEFLDRSTPMLPSEYPVLFWLGRLLKEDTKVFDLGGYLGLGYGWYRPYEVFPVGMRWTVYDVPAVVEAGKRMLGREPNAALHFTTEFSEAAGSDVLLAAGSLHFCEETLAEMLGPMERRPRYLLINKFPATDGATFYTLHNMGPAIAPYRVSNRAEFIGAVQALGYRLVDAWKNPELGCFIPFHPDESVEAFDGFYFSRD